MYRLLIVEDEDMLRDALMHSIDWAALGYDAREAQDGLRALEVARAFAPDIVLTDIRMPHMDGLQLAARLRGELPAAAVAILSGHDEFAYAQEALKLGVREYITKPVTPAELVAAVRRLASQVDERAARDIRLRKMESQLERSVPLLRQRLLNELAEGAIDAAEAAPLLEQTGLRLRGESYTACVIDCDFAPELSMRERMRLVGEALELAAAEVGTDAAAFALNAGGIALVYCARTVGDRERTFAKGLLCELRDELKDRLGLDTTAAIGEQVPELGQLSASLHSAREALAQRALHGGGRLYDARHVDGGTGRLIESACGYIHGRYTDSALSLNAVAAHVHISPTYLSILMKKKLNTTFSEYLIGLRLERAKELLRLTNLRTYEVATRTGYNDPQYFSVYFKKHTGLTPTEYRARHQGQCT